MTEEERCRHPDCIYRATRTNEKGSYKGGNCNYLTMTGRSRIKGEPGRLSLPCFCTEYVPSGQPPQKQKADWKDKALDLYNAGATDREIAEALGVKRDSVCAWRHRVGLPLHRDRMGPVTTIDWKRARELHRQGLNDREIAEAIGCGVNAVWRWRYKYELFPNSHGGRKKK